MTRRLLSAILAALALAAAPAPTPARPDATQPDPPAKPAPQDEPARHLFPDTPAGRAARLWFDAVRSGEQTRVEAMIRDRFDADFLERIPLPQHLTMHMRLARAGLGLPHSILSQSDHRIIYYLRDGGVWGQLLVQVAPTEPHGITNVAVRPSQPPPQLQGRPKTMAAFRDETAEFLRALHDSGRFDGTLIITRDGQRTMHIILPERPDQDPIPADTVSIPVGDLRDAITSTLAAWSIRTGRLSPQNPASTGSSPDDLAEVAAQIKDRSDNGMIRDVLDNFNTALNLTATDLDTTVPTDLSRLGAAVLGAGWLFPDHARAMTNGEGPDLDPSPRVTRRKALGFEERIEENAVRSFSATGGDEHTRVLLRCYPKTNDVVVIVAPDDRTLNLIDRRIYNRLPDLEPDPEPANESTREDD